MTRPKRSKSRNSGLICLLLLCAGSASVYAQNSMVFGSPVVKFLPGFGITTSVSRGATTSKVTYNITPPQNYVTPGDTTVGEIDVQVIAPNGGTVNGQATITFTGWANVLGQTSGGLFVAGGSVTGGSPQSPTFQSKAGAGQLSFFLARPSGNPGPAPVSSIAITTNIGDPSGGRRAYLNDYTGDGKSNYAVFRPMEGNWYLDTTPAPQTIQWGLPGDVPVPGDYDGDGITDVAVWRPSEQNWFVKLSSTGAEIVQQWGLPGDYPIVAGDYDGDGKTDFAVWRPSEGNWYVKLSSTGAEVVTQWGLRGDIPLTGNYDGDGKTDYVVWRPYTLSFYVLSSSNGAMTVKSWGLPNDIPLTGDYDGDGKTDYVVWRPLEANWYVTLSSTGAQVVTQWGFPSDIPVTGDFDGDGKTDYAVYRPSEGNWYIIYSSTGQQVVRQWGLDGDTPNGSPIVFAPIAPQ